MEARVRLLGAGSDTRGVLHGLVPIEQSFDGHRGIGWIGHEGIPIGKRQLLALHKLVHELG